jgi:hypothetical protein
VANQFAPFGLQDIQMREGNTPQMGLMKVCLASSDPTPIFTGDLVIPLNSTGLLSGGFGEYVTQGSSGPPAGSPGYSGVFKGCEYMNANVGRVVWSAYWPGAATPAGTDAIGYVTRAADMNYVIQCSTAAILGSSNINQNFSVTTVGVSMTSTIGNTTTGQSAIALASSISGSSGAGSSLAIRLKDFYSNFAPGTVFPAPGPAGGYPFGSFVNGADNTTPGQWVIVNLNNLLDYTSVGVSSAY